MGATLQVTGMNGIMRNLRRLGGLETLVPIVVQALEAASEPIVWAAKARLGAAIKGTEGTGNLLSSIGFVVRDSAKHSGRVYSVIGPRWPLGAHGHLFERGTVDRYRKTKAGGKAFTGRMPATPFLEPAFQENKARSLAIMERWLGFGLQRELATRGR